MRYLPILQQPWRQHRRPVPGAASRGTSFIEVLVVLSILAVLLAIAAPDLTAIIRNSRLNSQNSQLVYSLNLARSEAIKRMLPVVVCRGSAAAGCAGAGAWESGWIVFADLNENGSYDAPAAGVAGDGLLEASSGLRSGSTLRSSSSIPGLVRFDVQGGSSVSSVDAHFILCQDNRKDWARLVIVRPSGRIRRGTDDNRNGIPAFPDTNTEITSCTPA